MLASNGGTPAPRRAAARTARDARLARRGPSPATCCGSHCLLYPQPGVEHVTKTVAQEVQGEARESQRQTGEEAHPERLADDVLSAGDDVATRWHVLRHADADEAQDSIGHDSVSEGEY